MLTTLIMTTSVVAQAPAPQTTQETRKLSRLEDYIEMAIKQNPRLLASYQSYQASLERSGYAGALPDPMISYGHFFNEVETRVGPQKEKLSFRQTLPWFGTLGNKSDQAKLMASAAYEKYQADLLRTTFELKLNYFKLLNLETKEAVLSENKTLVDYWTKLIKTKYELGDKSHSDLLQAQIELALVDDQLSTLQNNKLPVKAKLKALLNGGLYEFTTDDVYQIDHLSLNEQLLLDSLALSNPNLERYHALIEVNQKNLELASKASYPNFTFGVDYIITDKSPMAGIEDNGKDPLMVSVGINLPLWFGKNKAKKQEARANLKAAEYSYQDKKNQLQSELESELAIFSDIKRKFSLYQNDIIPQAKQNLELLFKSYQLGESSIYDLFKVERELLKYQIMLEDLKYTGLATLAKIELLSNKNIL